HITRVGGNSVGTTTPGFLWVSDITSNAAGNAQITGNWDSSNNWGIGANSNASDNTLRIGATSSNAGSGWNNSQNVNLDITGTELVKPTTGNDSTTAFQIQSAGSVSL